VEHLLVVKAFRRIQETRKKLMMEGNFIAEATIIRAFKTENGLDDQNEAEVFITKNHLGKLYLWVDKFAM
jgi:hypothetical protein